MEAALLYAGGILVTIIAIGLGRWLAAAIRELNASERRYR